jgi:ferrous-iron efflux pump FieF
MAAQRERGDMTESCAELPTAAQARERSVFTGLLFGAVTLIPGLVAVILGHSTTLLADWLRSFSETFAILLSWLTLRKVTRGRRTDYDYGYGKLESLSSLIVAAAMTLSFAAIVFSAVSRIRQPEPVKQVGWGLLISTGAAVINVVLWRRNYRLAQQEQSPIMESQWRLFRAKAVVNVTVISALGLSVLLRRFTWSLYVDPIGSLIVAGFLLASAYQVASTSIYDLLDKALEESLQFVILQELAAHFDTYRCFHGVQSRRSGGDVYIELFLEFDGDLKMAEVQRRIDAIRSSLEARIQNSQVLVVPTSDDAAAGGSYTRAQI